MRLKLVTEFQQSHLFACLPSSAPPSLPASVSSSCSLSAWTREPPRRGKRDCPLFHNVTALFDSHMRSRSSFFGSFPHQHLMPWLIWFSLVVNLLSLAACAWLVCRLGTSGAEVFAPTSDLASRPWGRAVCSRVHGILPVLLGAVAKDLGTFLWPL